MREDVVEIDFLKNHPTALPVLARIWKAELGRLWQPHVTIEEVEERFRGHMKDEGVASDVCRICARSACRDVLATRD